MAGVPSGLRQEILVFASEDDGDAPKCLPQIYLDAFPRGNFVINGKLVRQEK